MQNALERLKRDEETQMWWQEVLDDPKFGLVVEALKALLEQGVPSIPPTTSVTEAFALAHAANVGVAATIKSLDQLGARAINAERAAAEKARRQQEVRQPSGAGTGYGRLAADADNV